MLFQNNQTFSWYVYVVVLNVEILVVIIQPVHENC